MRTSFVFASAFAVALIARGSGAEPAGAPVLRPFALMGNPPPVQMTVPGFVVRELPVQLTNINNLAYGPDGRLYAYAFDGKIHRLEDTDGDGLEDKASLFYANERGVIGTVGMRWGRDGLYLASRHQVMRFRDAHRQPADGQGKFEVLTSGWAPPDELSATSRYMDVYGLALDAEGNVFFGLGISDIRNAYRLDAETKKSRYSRTWDRGTIQLATPAGKRQIVATGLRFTVSLAFNAAGDLFATDQEGATWLANGNPFDELLHIQRGRHYGFPPRHPQHLPDVVDEPSLFDYGPQHQAVCSVNFNEPAKEGAPIFGPDWWRGDAIVTGSARGRIYRTALVKTGAGIYVARNETIAHLGMLTVEAVLTPAGDLLVSCHSGRPDWGTGPAGMGKLYQISYRDKTAPQPVFAYAASPTETRIVFDRPLASRKASPTENATMTMGEYVSSGDRFESIRPGYQAVKDQQKAPRFQLPILRVAQDSERAAVVLHTVARTAAVNYAIALPDAERASDPAKRELRQRAAIDIGMNLSGVRARWRDAAGAEKWHGWLPHLDLAVARAFTRASLEHAEFFRRLREPGILGLTTQLNLHSMLRPLIQPGAKLDYELPPENVRVRFVSDREFELKSPAPAALQRISARSWELAVDRVTAAWVPLTITFTTEGRSSPTLDVFWSTTEDKTLRALPLHRMLLPWAERAELDATAGARREIPEIAGGNWQRGSELFHGKASCAVCHQVDGKGGALGPDLSNLVHRDYASVLQDIVEPSAALNPDYLAVSMTLKRGGAVAGIQLQNTSSHYVLGQPNGETLRVARDDVEPGSTKPLGVSLMPPGLLEVLTAQERKDLLSFLLTVRPNAAR
jgi:putative heme-binding domain-containing protein